MAQLSGTCASSHSQMQQAGQQVPTSVANLPIALRYYRKVLVQDALELAPLYPNHPVHKFLMGLPQFPPLLADYQAKKAAKVRGQTGRGRRGVGRRGEGRWHACWPVRLQEPQHIAPLPPV